jgi:hypothetical protein
MEHLAACPAFLRVALEHVGGDACQLKASIREHLGQPVRVAPRILDQHGPLATPLARNLATADLVIAAIAPVTEPVVKEAADREI